MEKKCYESRHINPDDYGIYCLLRDMRGGKAVDISENIIANNFANQISRSSVHRRITRLIKHGWIERVETGARPDEPQSTATLSTFRILGHDEWSRIHPNRCWRVLRPKVRVGKPSDRLESKRWSAEKAAYANLSEIDKQRFNNDETAFTYDSIESLIPIAVSKTGDPCSYLDKETENSEACSTVNKPLSTFEHGGNVVPDACSYLNPLPVTNNSNHVNHINHSKGYTDPNSNSELTAAVSGVADHPPACVLSRWLCSTLREMEHLDLDSFVLNYTTEFANENPAKWARVLKKELDTLIATGKVQLDEDGEYRLAKSNSKN